MGKAVMKIINILGALAVSAAAITTPALAADVKFTGEVGSTCSLEVTRGGQLGVRPDYTELSSQKWDGKPGAVRATTTGGGFSIKVKKPESWDIAPTDYAGTTTFSAQSSIGGAQPTGAKKALTETQTDVEVHMAAATTEDALFTRGNYEATVVVTCEADTQTTQTP